MEQNPFLKANHSSAGHEIPRILCNQKVQYHFHNSPLLFLIPSQIDPTHTIPSCFFMTHFNIILPSTPRSSKRSLSPQVSPPKPCMHLSSLLLRATCPAHFILLDFITQKLLIMRSPAVPSLDQTSSSAPYSRTHSAYVFPSV